MPKVMFFFAGTNETATGYYENDSVFTDFQPDDDVIKIYIDGCQSPLVGGGAINPNLGIVTGKIDKLFKSSNGVVTLDIEKLKEEFGGSVIISEQKKGATNKESTLDCTTKTVAVDGITLSGFSRGAWTAIQQAKILDRLDIPLYLAVDQPVVGKGIKWFNSKQQKKEADCSEIKNLRQFYGFYGEYHLNSSIIEREYFWQTVPLFANDTTKPRVSPHIYALPHQDHFESHRGKKRHKPSTSGLLNRMRQKYDPELKLSSSPMAYHMRYALKSFVCNEEKLNIKDEGWILYWYAAQFFNESPCYFTPDSLKQPIFGAYTESNFQEDPYYYKALSMYIEQRLLTEKIVAPEDLVTIKSDPKWKQKSYAIYHLSNYMPQLSSEITSYILCGDAELQNEILLLVDVINEVGEVCNYIRNEKKSGKFNSQAINQYQSLVCDTCYKKMVGDITMEECIQKISDAENKLAVSLVSFPSLYLCYKIIRKAISKFFNSEPDYSKSRDRFFKVPLEDMIEDGTEKLLGILKSITPDK
ncbi:MAG: hypothetical protein P1U74_01230 [Legionellaceae bacterium]|nr:hypothetical protein [Legionellaceae bacterium]